MDQQVMIVDSDCSMDLPRHALLPISTTTTCQDNSNESRHRISGSGCKEGHGTRIGPNRLTDQVTSTPTTMDETRDQSNRQSDLETEDEESDFLNKVLVMLVLCVCETYDLWAISHVYL